ncbi:MAG TPA: DUF288 domain-containing protein [Ignavibacteria bacterium]|nr:DUF288 domain-containing protein [Ignavibacteria bacterium]
MQKFIIITTINKKTEAINKFSTLLKDWQIILIGDKKSKNIKSEGNITFLSVEDQKKLNFKTAKISPYNHYARKNIGYLYAMKLGADIIYDTDDDNIPYDDWIFTDFKHSEYTTSKNKFLNIYKYFTKENVWPRGYPLDEINKKSETKNILSDVKVGVWQGLADIDPDVDAIFRLTINKKITFDKNKSVVLDKNIYCPFNSQNTLWHKDNFALLYFPSTVSFRFTDILRGYITQKLLWENNYHLGFTQATVYQKRNSHDLMKDFNDEIECYLNIKSVVNILDKLNFNSNYLTNLRETYIALKNNKIVTATELERLDAWINDLKNLI